MGGSPAPKDAMKQEAQLTNGTSMGWFPGYAIDLETGERLNIGYGEDSFWAGEIGRDMIWNPNDKLYTTVRASLFGGGHWIYVFKNDRRTSNVPSGDRAPTVRPRAVHPVDHGRR